MDSIEGALRERGIEIEAEIGRGARGVVYRARRDGRTLALKVPTASDDAWFRREGAILGCIRHRGLAEVLEVDQVGDLPYLLREYLDGETLATELEGGPLSESRLVEVGITLAEVLAEVHRRGLVHRDVQPHNIILLRNGGAKLIDFGLATHTRHRQPGDQAVGTFRYAAPEQAGMLKRPVDGRADLYALGAILFECASGHPPFQAERLADLLRQHAVVPPPRLTGVSPALAALIDRLLAKDPDDRYQTGDGLAGDLRALTSLNVQESFRLGSRDGPAEGHFEPVLVGRESLLARLEEAYDRASRGHGGAVFVQGDSGMGKSRLVSEFLKAFERPGRLRLIGRCRQDVQIPLSPLREAADETLGKLDRFAPDLRAQMLRRARETLSHCAPLLKRFTELSTRLFEESGAPLDLEQADSGQFHEAIAEGVLGLCDVWGGGVLFLDDVQWLDASSLEVLRYLVPALEHSRVLLVCAARHEVPELLEVIRPEWRLELEPLDSEQVGRLLAAYLGGRKLDPALVRQIALLSLGNALSVGEYVRMMLEDGLLRLSPSGWVLRPGAVQALELPQGMLDLVLKRIAGMTAEDRAVLVRAALMGPRFALEPLREVCGEDVELALAEAVRLQLIEREAGHRYLFVHDRLREALVSELDADQAATIHLRIARALESAQGDEVFQVARHYALAGPGQEPARVYAANLRAGQRALESFAYEEAYRFLQAAARASQSHTAEFLQTLAEVCYQTRRLTESAEACRQALELTRDPLPRAQLWGRLADVSLRGQDRGQARQEIDRALAELGGTPIRKGALAPLRALTVGVRAFGSDILGLTRRSDPQQRELRQTLSRLYEQLARVYFAQTRYAEMFEAGCRSGLEALRLGPSRELCTIYAVTATVGALAGLPPMAEHYARKAERMARQLGDPISLARSHLYHALACNLAGQAPRAEGLMDQHFERDSQWLSTREYLDGCWDMSWNLMMRGYAREALTWVERAEARYAATLTSGTKRQLSELKMAAVSLLMVLGRSGEALQKLELEGRTGERYLEGSLQGHLVCFYLEQGELGAPLAGAAQIYRELGLKPARVKLHRKHFYVFHAYARLELFRKKPEDAAPLRAALRELKACSSLPILRVHYHVIEAVLARLQGNLGPAVVHLSLAERLAAEVDSPWALYEVMREKAHRLEARGYRRSALRQARLAHSLAQEHGWANRARWLRREFPRGWSAHGIPDRTATVVSQTRSGEPLHLKRQLDALLELSRASTAVLDPERQARVALDETVRLLGAERGFLFVLGPEGLVPVASRDAFGRTLPPDAPYSRTVVDEVRATRHAVIVSGSEDDQALSSQSAVLHNLRSIIAAPLTLHRAFYGVLYLDNRLARGVFHEDDAEILKALGGYIAVALERAQAAELELAFEVERQQRELAETMRDLNSALAATLEPAEVVDHLVKALAERVPSQRAMVHFGLAREGALMMTAAEDGFSELPGCNPGTDQVWFGVPLVSKQVALGLLTLHRSSAQPFTDRERELVLTFAGQAGVALEKARLFAEVVRLARHDALTGCFNRRYFYELAERELQRSHRARHPLAAILLDVDHFKKFNDTYGHAVGDEVLRQVARVLGAELREIDLLGRYGGEEFVVLLPYAEPEAARTVAERLRQAVAATRVTCEGHDLGVHISLGLAQHSDPAEGLEELLKRADGALYQAKANGRNRVEVG